jgi:alpha-ketoglutarate-dependent taurine dioxygenase
MKNINGGESWHTDVSYNVKPTKVIVLKLIKIPPVGGDTMFSNMELAWDNRSVIHQGLTDFFPGRGLGYERIMDRIAIEGNRAN